MHAIPALAGGLLALACLACTLAIGRARPGYGEADQPALFCALLGFLMAAAAAAAGALPHSLDPGRHAAELWLSQASGYLGLPLLGAAGLAMSRGWSWSRPTWGRILLGLCACFELFRQLDQLEPYRLALQLATLPLIVYAGAVQWPRRAPLAAAAGAAGLLLLAEVADRSGTPGLHALALTPAYALLAWLLLALPGAAQERDYGEKPAKAL